jgi:hypothetical protein
MPSVLVLYRGGDGSKLSPAANQALMKKWDQYKAIQTLSKTCPHLTVADGTIEILPLLDMP